MLVRFAGGLHYDPTARPACHQWLSDLSDDGPPAFVAVEWDSGIEPKVTHDRERFTQKWVNFRAQDPPDLVRQLAESIAWESDVWKAPFGGANVVWLDEDREEPPSARDLASGRLFDFQLALAPPDPRECPIDEVIERIHEYWLRDAAASVKAMVKGRDTARDHLWADRLAAHLREPGWGLVIAGAIHASTWDSETLFSLLRETGHECETRQLVWTPTIP